MANRLTAETRAIRKTVLFKNLEAAILAHRDGCRIDRQTALVDVLADLQHLADKYRLDWEEIAAAAAKHHAVEIGEAADV